MAKRRVNEYRYVLVDFPDGPTQIQGSWITEDLKYAAFPPQAMEMQGLAYDKFLQACAHEPEEDWDIYPIKVRAFHDDFAKIRLKLKEAEERSDTDLNSCDENSTLKGRNLRLRTIKKAKSSKEMSSDEENSASLAAVFPGISVPGAPPPPSKMKLGEFMKRKIKEKSSVSNTESEKHQVSKANAIHRFENDGGSKRKIDFSEPETGDVELPSQKANNSKAVAVGGRENLWGKKAKLVSDSTDKKNESSEPPPPKSSGSTAGASGGFGDLENLGHKAKTVCDMFDDVNNNSSEPSPSGSTAGAGKEFGDSKVFEQAKTVSDMADTNDSNSNPKTAKEKAIALGGQMSEAGKEIA